MNKLFLSLILAAAPAAWAQAVYEIDASHSSAQFSVRHMMVSNTKGEFTKISGTIEYDPKNIAASKVEATIDVASVNTRDAKRDDHLRSADFFDVAKYPTMTFRSKQVWREAGKLKVKGDLTLHGVTREVVLDVDGPTPEVKDPWGSSRIGASATTKISRKDFGITWNKSLDTGGVVVGDEVQITIDVEAVRKAPGGKKSD
jgi:polyisoprenoid-binding protein YceI